MSTAGGGVKLLDLAEGKILRKPKRPESNESKRPEASTCIRTLGGGMERLYSNEEPGREGGQEGVGEKSNLWQRGEFVASEVGA